MNEATIPHLGCIDRSAAIKEQALFGPYLSNDLETIIAAAEKAGGGMFFALATANLTKRREAALKWRGKTLQEAAGMHENLNRATTQLPAEFLRDAYAGAVPLCDFEREALSALQLASQAKLERKRAAIGGVRERIRQLHFNDGGKPRDIPSDMVVLQDGSLSFHSNTTGAKAFGRDSGQAFFHCRIDRSSGRFHELPEGHCAGDVLLQAGSTCGCAGSTDTETDAPETSAADPAESLSDSGKAPESSTPSEESEKPSPVE